MENKSKPDKPGQPENIRKSAEEHLGKLKASRLEMEVYGDINKLVHELQVHQIELEMQNEELRRAQQELQVSRNNYFDFYNFSQGRIFYF
jgi:hypothetical protein